MARYVDKDLLELEIFKSIIGSIGANDFVDVIDKAIGWLAIEVTPEIKEVE